MQHPGAPVQLAGVQLQREGRLGPAVRLHVQLLQLVDVARVQLPPRDVVPVKPEIEIGS